MRFIELALFSTALAVCLSSCGGETKLRTPSEVIVEIDAEDAVRSAAASLRVQVDGADGTSLSGRVQRLDESVKPIAFPKRVALVPLEGDERRAFALTATVYDAAGAFLAQARLISGYVPNRVRYARLLIEGDQCLRRECKGARDTCTAGQCVDAQVDPNTFSQDSDKPTLVAFGGSSGSGGDAGSSGPREDGGATGACPAGYSGSGASAAGCTDDDECSVGALSACGEGATECTNSDGSYSCACTTGYVGTGTTACHEIDECEGGVEAGCGAGGLQCENLMGSFRCTCGAGYLVDSATQRCRPRVFGKPRLVADGFVGVSGDLLVGTSPARKAVLTWAALYQGDTGSKYKVHAVRFDSATGTFATAEMLNPTGANASPSSIVVNDAGDAVIAWDGQRPGIIFESFSARYGSGGWAQETKLPGSFHTSRARLAFDPMGNVLAIYLNASDEYVSAWSVWLARMAADGSWNALHQVENYAGTSESPALRFDGGDRLYTAWMHRDSGTNTIFGTDSAPGIGWSNVRSLSSASETGYNSSTPSIASDSAQGALVTWEGQDGSIWAARYRPQTGWETATRVHLSANEKTWRPVAALDGAGNAVVVWPSWPGTSDASMQAVWASEYSPAGGWTPAHQISADPAGSTGAVNLAQDADGNVYVAWSQASHHSIEVARYTAKAGWSRPETVTTLSDWAYPPTIFVDATGAAVVAWIPNTSTSVWSSRYE